MPSQSLQNFLRSVAAFCLLVLAVTFSSRLVLIIWLNKHFSTPNDVLQVIMGGLRVDFAVLGQLLLLPIALFLLIQLMPAIRKLAVAMINIWLLFWFSLIVFMEASTIPFIQEYGVRPNRLFIEYLNAPNTVFDMLIHGFLLELLSVLVISTVLISQFLKRFTWVSYKSGPLTLKQSATNSLTLISIFLVAVIVGRSGLQHRPLNPAMVAFSNDRLLNSLPLNSAYSVGFAAYRYKNDDKSDLNYGALDKTTMLSIVQHYIDPQQSFEQSELPTLHKISPLVPSPNGKNLIIIVEESLGAQFVSSLGGRDLTPYIDSWKDKSWFFDNFYATGIRSARGLEAIVTGFLPTAATSVLKRPKAQQNFFTLAQILKEQGYYSSFIYGGEGHFDNMKGFFLANGFDRVIDQNDFENPQFEATWGVSDEDLFNKAFSLLIKEQNKPQFMLVFSSSNHTPFEIPSGKIDTIPGDEQANAIKYADFALGNFLSQLENSNQLKKSVIAVAADHDARVKGASLVPIEHYHIPAFIISNDIPAHEDERISSQIDLAPTLLSLLGLSVDVPLIGHDLTKEIPLDMQRAIMQYGENQAFMTKEAVVFLQPDKPLKFEASSAKLTSTNEQTLKQAALAHANIANWLYQRQKYRLH